MGSCRTAIDGDEGFLQFEKRISAVVNPRVRRLTPAGILRYVGGRASISFELRSKTIMLSPGFWGRGLASAGKPMTESFKFSFYEFVSRFSVSELHWCAPTEGVFRLFQPGGRGGFVAKDMLGLALNQHNIIHYWHSWSLSVGARF